MKTKIFEYKKTHHFMFRQWERKLDDQTLYKILPYIQNTTFSKIVAIFFPTFLERKKILRQNKTESLVIIIKKRIILVTFFWCNSIESLKEKKIYLQIFS